MSEDQTVGQKLDASLFDLRADMGLQEARDFARHDAQEIEQAGVDNLLSNRLNALEVKPDVSLEEVEARLGVVGVQIAMVDDRLDALEESVAIISQAPAIATDVPTPNDPLPETPNEPPVPPPPSPNFSLPDEPEGPEDPTPTVPAEPKTPNSPTRDDFRFTRYEIDPEDGESWQKQVKAAVLSSEDSATFVFKGDMQVTKTEWFRSFTNGADFIGLPDANGKRPHIRGIAPDNSSAATFLHIYAYCNGDFKFKGLEISDFYSYFLKCGSFNAPTDQNIYLDNMDIHDVQKGVMFAPETPNEETGARIDDELYVTNSEFHNFLKSHGLYCDHIAVFHISDSQLYDPHFSYHCMKSEAWDTRIERCEFSNIGLDGTVTGRHIGAAPLSLIAAGKIFMKDVRLLNNGERHTATITKENRWALSGGDLPARYDDKTFDWDGYAAAGGFKNDPRFHAHYENVTFDWRLGSRNPAKYTNVWNFSSFPSGKVDGSVQPMPELRHEQYQERSRDYFLNCTTLDNNSTVMLPSGWRFGNDDFAMQDHGIPESEMWKVYQDKPDWWPV